MLQQLSPTCVALCDSDRDDVRLAVPLRLMLLDSEAEDVSVCMAHDGKTGKHTAALAQAALRAYDNTGYRLSSDASCVG
jgi:hypothetical protein